MLTSVFGMLGFSGEAVFVVALASILAVRRLRQDCPKEDPRAYLKKGASYGSLVGAAIGLVLIVGERLNGPSYGLYFAVVWIILFCVSVGGISGTMVFGVEKVARAVVVRTTASSQNRDAGRGGREEGPPSKGIV